MQAAYGETADFLYKKLFVEVRKVYLASGAPAKDVPETMSFIESTPWSLI